MPVYTLCSISITVSDHGISMLFIIHKICSKMLLFYYHFQFYSGEFLFFLVKLLMLKQLFDTTKLVLYLSLYLNNIS